jgi:NADPH:quinone reductase-like Zn-dependent oxidoreductase
VGKRLEARANYIEMLTNWPGAERKTQGGGTAWAAPKQLGIRAGETLLVHAAADGVGTCAVQLAAARGVRVIGTASERNHEHLRSLGAEKPVTYGDGLLERVLSTASQGVDAVLDASGWGELPISIKLTRGPDRVLTLVAFDAAATGIQIHVDGPLK